VNEGESASSKAGQLLEQAAAAQAEVARLIQEARAWEAGAAGERRVAQALSVLTRASNVIVMHDRLLRPGRSQANLDHIVVSPAGTHLVDAKNWAGNVNVHQGSLWRHKPDGQGGRSSDCMNAEVDKVRHMAEAMETLSSCVVEPVLCLTGSNAHRFGPDQLVRGVHIVPVDQISNWLASRQRTQPDAALPVLAQRLEGLFPAATGPWSGLTPAPNPGSRSRNYRQTASHPRRIKAGAPTRATQPSGRRRRENRGAAKSVLGLLGMTAIVLFGAKVLPTVVQHGLATITHLATKTVGSSANAAGQSTQPSKTATGRSVLASVPPCRVLTDSAISQSLGVPVYPVATALPDTCQWGLRLDDQSTVVASATTGWLASFNTAANNAKRAIYQDRLGSLDVSIIVPQRAAVPGSNVAAARITQPIEVSLETYSLGKSGRRFSDDQARSLVTRWAQQVATAMPQGPGADSIHP
jgi:Nuclease-related domain